MKILFQKEKARILAKGGKVASLNTKNVCALIYPSSDRQLENLPAVFGQGVKKRNGRRLAGNPADFVNTLVGKFWVSLRMVW